MLESRRDVLSAIFTDEQCGKLPHGRVFLPDEDRDQILRPD
jgi:hypothetical protein